MVELLCLGGKADGKWVDVDLRQRTVGDHWQVPIMPPLDVNQWEVPKEPITVNVEVYRVECLHIADPRGTPYPPRKIHFLVKESVDLFDAMVLLFRSYKPESRDDAEPN